MKTAANLQLSLATAIFCSAALVTSPLSLRSSRSLQNPTPQASKTITLYDDPDAYQLYAFAMPPANKMFVVAETTLGHDSVSGADECIQKTREFGIPFESALTNFKQLSDSPKRLAGKWPADKQVEVISDTNLAQYQKRGRFNWDAFYKRYPNSIGIFRFSAVGFNEDKTKAMFYRSISGGGGFMGDGGFYVFQKVANEWHQLSSSGANYCFEIH
jgi:hypothetical protein